MTDIFVRIKRAEYDNLCHEVRHLTTLAKRVGKRSARIETIMHELAEELVEKRTELSEKIKTIEGRLLRLEGSVLPCNECPKNGSCNDTNSGNSKT